MIKKFKIITNNYEDSISIYNYLFSKGIEFPFDAGKKHINKDLDKIYYKDGHTFYIDEGTIFDGSDNSNYGKKWLSFYYLEDKEELYDFIKEYIKYINLEKNRGNVITWKSKNENHILSFNNFINEYIK